MSEEALSKEVAVLRERAAEFEAKERGWARLSARHEAILAEIPDIIMEVDAGKVYTWANDAGYKFFGDDVICREAAYYFEGEQDTYNTVQPLFEGDDNVIYLESWQRRQDGEKRLLAWWCRVLKGPQGTVTGALSTARDITEHERAREEKERILNLSCDLICIAGMDGYFKYVNPAWQAMLGYSKKELLSRPFLDFIHPDDHARNDEEVEHLFEGRPTDSFENRYIHKDGSSRTISWTATPLPERAEIYCVGRDIAEHRQTEDARRRSEEKFRALFENSPDIVALADLDGTFLDINKVAPGYTKEDVIGGKFTDYLTPEQARLFTETMEKVLKTGEAQGYEVEITNPEGRTLNWFNRISPVETDGKISQVVVNCTDITDHKLIEQELVEHRDHLEELVEQRSAELARVSAQQRVILDSVRATIWYKDAKNNILRVNKAAADAVGLSVEDIEGKATAELFPNEAEKYYADDLEVLRSGQPKLGIVEPLVSPSGERMWVLTDKIPYRDENGEIAGVIAFALDVTEQKRAEIELKELAAELQTMVDAMSGREVRMAELKEQIKVLRAQLVEAGLTPVADGRVPGGADEEAIP